MMIIFITIIFVEEINKIDWPRIYTDQVYLIEITPNIVIIRRMQDKRQDIKYYISQLQENSAQTNTPYFQENLNKVLSQSKFIPLTAYLTIKSICKYGFAFLLALRPLYEVMDIKASIELRCELIYIELITLKLFGSFTFANFQELQFLKHSSKKALKKMHKAEQNSKISVELNKQLLQRSQRFMRNIIKLKTQIARIERLSFEEAYQLKKIYKCITKLCQRPYEYSYFENVYHFFILSKAGDALKTFKSKNIQNQKALFVVCKIIHQMDEVDKLLPPYYSQMRPSDNRQIDTIYSITSSKNHSFVNKSQKIPNEQFQQQQITQDLQERQFQHKSNIHKEQLINFNPSYSKLTLPAKEFYGSYRPQISKTSHAKRAINKTYDQFICCRRSFYQNQIIEQAESLKREYKFYSFPFDSKHISILCKTMVAFLNCQGGIIYIGIKEECNKMRKVIGIRLNQSRKQQFLKTIRLICDRIEPQILSFPLVQVKFVPIKSAVNNSFVCGKYIAKVIIQMGKPKELYFSKSNDEGIKVAFRTENQVLVKDPKMELGKILQVARSRLLDSPRSNLKDHQWQCPQPQVGFGSYE